MQMEPTEFKLCLSIWNNYSQSCDKSFGAFGKKQRNRDRHTENQGNENKIADKFRKTKGLDREYGKSAQCLKLINYETVAYAYYLKIWRKTRGKKLRIESSFLWGMEQVHGYRTIVFCHKLCSISLRFWPVFPFLIFFL